LNTAVAIEPSSRTRYK